MILLISITQSKSILLEWEPGAVFLMKLEQQFAEGSFCTTRVFLC